jgi:hypothetical protein
MSVAETCCEAAAYLIGNSADRTLLFGPVAWLPSDGTSARRWYLIVIGCDQAGETWLNDLGAETKGDTEALRASVMAALIEHRPCVMHDFDDELEMVKWAEAVWPSTKIMQVREGVEAERKQGAAAT